MAMVSILRVMVMAAFTRTRLYKIASGVLVREGNAARESRPRK